MRATSKTIASYLCTAAVGALAWTAASPSYAPPAMFQHAGEMRGAGCVSVNLGTYIVAGAGSSYLAGGCDTTLTTNCGGGTTCKAYQITSGAVSLPITSPPGIFGNTQGTICPSCCPLDGLEGSCLPTGGITIGTATLSLNSPVTCLE